ncbi:hypothetical protein NDU88_006858 [Pleurodeles waltl]|uniref:Uncharacterized protein n=1 Tax=Pleurodeles waltl TaxID=8319 RepID=A0AAV7QMA6_PLEWA|nr:hypothetical protein NDU88_006858 [Pleurodeles waltl]
MISTIGSTRIRVFERLRSRGGVRSWEFGRPAAAGDRQRRVAREICCNKQRGERTLTTRAAFYPIEHHKPSDALQRATYISSGRRIKWSSKTTPALAETAKGLWSLKSNFVDPEQALQITWNEFVVELLASYHQQLQGTRPHSLQNPSSRRYSKTLKWNLKKEPRNEALRALVSTSRQTNRGRYEHIKETRQLR